jgi:hypothetical protein
MTNENLKNTTAASAVANFAANKLLPAELEALTANTAGKGVSFKPEDQAIPLIYVLQKSSPTVNKRDPAYLDGAEPGCFWLRGAIEPIIDGLRGFEAIPCGTSHCWIEWLPDRQGFVAKHDAPPADLADIVDPKTNKRVFIRAGSKNVIQDTREFLLWTDSGPLCCRARARSTSSRGGGILISTTSATPRPAT